MTNYFEIVSIMSTFLRDFTNVVLLVVLAVGSLGNFVEFHDKSRFLKSILCYDKFKYFFQITDISRGLRQKFFQSFSISD